MSTTVEATTLKKKGPFWRRKNPSLNTLSSSYSSLEKSPTRVFRKKVLTSRHKPAPLPHDFEKIPLEDSPVVLSNVRVINQPHKHDKDTTKKGFETPKKKSNGIHSYPTYSNEVHRSVLSTPQTEASATPSPNRWQSQKEVEQVQSILRLQQLAEQYSYENSPPRNKLNDQNPNRPSDASSESAFKQERNVNTSKLLETVLGVSTACAPPPARKAIRQYASNPTPPSKVVSMTMIKDGSMKFAEAVKDSVLKIVQCAGDLPLDDDGTTARGLCALQDPDILFREDGDERSEDDRRSRRKQHVTTSVRKQTMDKNFTYHDDNEDEDDDNYAEHRETRTPGPVPKESTVRILNKDAFVMEEAIVSRSMGKMQVSNRGETSRLGMESHSYTSFQPTTFKTRDNMLDLATADPLASNIPFDERSLSGENRKKLNFENDRHARAIALGLDDESMLSHEGGEI